jgi:hypothetical protein
VKPPSNDFIEELLDHFTRTMRKKSATRYYIETGSGFLPAHIIEEQFIADYIEKNSNGLDQREANQRAVLALLATGHQPSQFLLNLIAGELQHYWSSDPMERGRSHRKRRAAIIDGEIAVLAKQLRRRGVSDPITRAEKEIAERWHHASGSALNRWLRRNR